MIGNHGRVKEGFMQGSGVVSSSEEERAEIATVAEALVRSPRLVHLLQYMGEKYFRGESDQLKEYNIATEVFGRPANFFNPTDDAIARVEAHRLRKRLKEYYETEGKDHSIHISIPFGTYVPVFTHRTNSLKDIPSPEPAETPPVPAPLAVTESSQPAPQSETLSPWRERRFWLSAVVVAGPHGRRCRNSFTALAAGRQDDAGLGERGGTYAYAAGSSYRRGIRAAASDGGL